MHRNGTNEYIVSAYIAIFIWQKNPQNSKRCVFLHAAVIAGVEPFTVLSQVQLDDSQISCKKNILLSIIRVV